MQGGILEPFSFDIHNMISDGIVISLPPGFETKGTVLKVEYISRFQAGIVDVFHNQNDKLGIEVESDSDGWILYHSPYDENWKAKINGDATPLLRANGAFTTLPVRKGANKIEYSYMPDSWIRELILLSLVTSLMIFIVLIVKTLTVTKEDQ